jgi:hypothetical protein
MLNKFSGHYILFFKSSQDFVSSFKPMGSNQSHHTLVGPNPTQLNNSLVIPNQIQTDQTQKIEPEDSIIDLKSLMIEIVVKKNQKLLFDNYSIVDLNEVYDFFGCTLSNCYYVFTDYSENKFKKQVYFVSFTHPQVKKENILWTPLQWAAAIGDEEIIQFLLNNGAIDDKKDLTGRNAQEISNYLLHDIKIINNSIKKKLISIIPKINDINFKFRNK